MDRPGKVTNPARPFAPENLVSRGGFGSAVPRQPAYLHTQAESGTCLLTGFLPISADDAIDRAVHFQIALDGIYVERWVITVVCESERVHR